MSNQDYDHPTPDPAVSGPVARIASRLASLVWWTALTILVLLAMYAGIGRQLTANLDSFTDELEQELSARSRLDISIDRLSSRWNWLDPSVIATGLVVTNAENGETIADLEHLIVELDFWSSLARQRIVFKDIEADGLQLTLVRPENSPLPEAMAELVPMPETRADEWQEWVELAGRWLSEPEARITRVSLAVGRNRDNLRDLYIPQLDLSYRRGLFQASGRAMQAGTATQLASFSLVGQHFFRGDFTGQLYLDVDSGRLFDGLLDDLSWRDLRAEGFDLGGEAWVTLANGEIRRVQGTVSTPYLQLGVGSDSLAPLEDIQARFGWLPGEALIFQDLSWRWQEETVPAFNLSLRQGSDGQAVIRANALPLSPIRGLVQALALLPEQAGSALEHYQPSGYLDEFKLVIPEQAEQFELTARLREAGVQGWRGTPEASDVYGQLQVDATGGYVDLDTGKPATVGFPQLFAGAWDFTRLQGRVSWQMDGPITRVGADNLEATYGDDTRVSGGFELRLDKQGEDNLGLRVAIQNGDASMLAGFVPVDVVNEELYQWLTTAVEEGRISDGRFYGHGRIDRGAPRGGFVASMWYEFEDGQVRYDPSWPLVQGAAGRVRVQGGDAWINLNEGETGGLDISGTKVRLQAGGDDPARLLIETAPKVSGERVSWWLANTPLGQWAGEGARQAQYNGQFGVDLDIDLPLVADAEPTVQAMVRTSGAGFRLPQTGLSWQEIEADLTYHTRKGFSGGPVTARFMGAPVALDFTRSDRDDAVAIRQTGRLTLPDVLTEAGLAENQSLGMSGTLDYTAGLLVDSEGASEITLSSDLTGLTVGWPAPLGKSASEATDLTVEVNPFVSEGVDVATLWQDRMDFRLNWRADGFDLQFDQLNLGDQKLSGVQVSGSDLGDRWLLSTDSEVALGQVVYPKDGSAIKVDLKTLRLPGKSGETGITETTPAMTEAGEDTAATLRELDLAAWPGVDVTLNQLWLGEQSAGSWRFLLRPQDERIEVQSIDGHLGELRLKGNLTWSLLSGRETSRFQGELSGGALRDLQALTGTPIPLENEKTEVALDLEWPGSPDRIDPARLSGEIRGRLDDGVILEESGSAQLFRVFNLLNTDTLWRRLKLDFSDLYEAGVAFDAISGKMKLVDGLVTMDPELQLVGPSGAFKLSGATNMADESLDMRLVVVLPVTQNLPLAALLMGAGAPIGGALFVLDKILGDPLSKLTSATYSVTGSWNDPEVDLRGVFDTD
ncbi:YhdP family phospholipid transporter [Marinobacter oulmenensis]|uniref:Uncharacterized protein YhdP n=1 Tax=Marinobacter oulmenensis TaxID=643747 RepID=A0A840UMP2_9GAMM|nr:AsmA-like C-terminal region-containing protein [Marinobacter oulmenensis]MBB5322117.1 uncharacterized protein YhdP [Marinobacter oulmenensis]